MSASKLRTVDEPLGKEMAEKIMNIPGEARGASFKPNWDYINQTKGPEGIAVLEREMAKIGYPILYRDIKESSFYPIGYDILGMIIMEEVMGFKNEDFYYMGIAGAKLSLFLRIVMKYFVSPERTLQETPSIWRKHYTEGRLEVIEWDKKERKVTVRLHDFGKYRKSMCWNVLGYFTGVWQIVTGEPVRGEEQVCSLESEKSYHEFVFRW